MHNDRKRGFGQFRSIIAIAISLGIFLRFFQLDRKVYWLDEVYSTTRIAGYSIEEVRQSLFRNQIVSAPELQKYQRPKPNSTIADTIDVLIQEDAKHPPLYYGLARVWMRQFGSSIAASRSLPAAIGLLALPLMFALSLELFSSSVVAYLATAAIALSPFDILFAQTVRQYSLLTVTILASSWLLLRATRLRRWQDWGGYTLACAMGLYTHLLFVLTLLGQGVYVVARQIFKLDACSSSDRKSGIFVPYLLSIVGTIVLYIPWIVALLTGGDRTFESANWLSSPVSFIDLLKFWILSFSSLFFDLDVGFDSPITYLLRLPFIILIFVSIRQVWSSRLAGGFILTSIMVPFLALAVPDFLLGGRRSAVTRYLICSFPGIQLAVASLLGTYLLRRRLWQGIWAVMLTASLTSCLVSASSSTWWSKGASYANAKTASVLNRLDAPLVVSDRGDNYLNQGNLISLSYQLDADVQLLLIDDRAIVEGLATAFQQSENKDVLLYSPSSRLRSEVEAKWGSLTPVGPQEAGLLRFESTQLANR